MENEMMRRRGQEAVFADPAQGLLEAGAKTIDQPRAVGVAVDCETTLHRRDAGDCAVGFGDCVLKAAL